MNDHDPDPEFVEHLEWQLTTALRRRGRFARPASGRAGRALRTGALMLVCLVGGAGVVVGAEHLRQSREKELLLAKNEVQVETALLRLEVEQRRLDRVKALHEQGVIDSGSLADSRLAVDDSSFELERLQLAGEEIAASGRSPDRDLTAPPVRRRDFVSEALRIERKRAGLAYQRAAEELERIERLAESGLISDGELREARERTAGIEGELRSFDERLSLRADFLAGRRDARSTVLLELKLLAQGRLERAERAVEKLHARLERLQALHRAGVVTEGERAEAESALLRAENELELQSIELELVRERL